MDGVNTTINSGEKNRRELMEAIVAEHETALLRYATRMLNNPVSAQDVVQNAFIKLFRNWHEGAKPSSHLKGWLYKVTHNEAVDFIRRESRLNILHGKHAEENASDCPDGIHCPASVEDKKAEVLKMLKQLHPREQQVILLRMEEGLSYKEISEVTGRSEGNVGNILHHAIKKLSSKLKSGNQEKGLPADHADKRGSEESLEVIR